MSVRSLLPFLLALTAGCSAQSVVDTTANGRLSRDARVTGPRGLEQRLSVVVDPEDFRQPGFHTLRVTSDVENAGVNPVQVTARVCLFLETDVEITAEGDRFEPFVTCAAVQQTRELAPGESVGAMQLHYRLRSGPGVYTIRLRHALDPEFRAEASFRIP